MTIEPEDTREKPAERTDDGKFAFGNSIGSAGRPKGSRNRATIAAESLIEGHARAISNKAVELALSGDITAVRLCLERLVPPAKDRSVSIDLPAMTTASGISLAAERVLQATGSGELTPHEATRLMALIETRRKALETEELERRIEQLEQARGSAR